jgi:hypothetical protein
MADAILDAHPQPHSDNHRPQPAKLVLQRRIQGWTAALTNAKFFQPVEIVSECLGADLVGIGTVKACTVTGALQVDTFVTLPAWPKP